MKNMFFASAALLLMLPGGRSEAVSQEKDMAVVVPASDAAEGLDLQAVGGLFRDSRNLEEFEKSLNDPDNGVNNLDLNGDGDVDFIRVTEEAGDGAHLVILQAALGKDEFQDVATIEVEKSGDDCNMQVHGNEVIYGVNFYVAPVHVRVGTWPIIGWIYRPVYHPYRSAFYYGSYPRWWRPFHPLDRRVYRARVGKYRSTSFAVSRTTRVKSVTRVHYQPRTSTLVKTKTTVRHPKGGKKTTVTRTRTTKRRR